MFYNLIEVDNIMEICKHIKNHREKREMSQKQLAELLKISNSTLSGYENGVSFPSIDILINMADIFGISLDELVGRKNEFNDTSKVYIPVIKSLSANNILNEDNIKSYFPVPANYVKFKCFLYQTEDDLFYNVKIGRGEYLLIATDAPVKNGDTIIYSVGKSENKAGFFNVVPEGVVISDFDGKVKFINEKTKLKIKGIVKYRVKRLK